MPEALFALERQLLDPETRKDRAWVEAVLSPDFQEFGSSGIRYSREEVLEALASERPVSITADHFEAHIISHDAMLVTYVSRHADAALCLRSSIWKLTDEKWQLLFHQGTKM